MKTKRDYPTRRKWKDIEISTGKFFVNTESGNVIEIAYVPPAEAGNKSPFQFVAHKDGKRMRAAWMQRDTLLMRYRELPAVVMAEDIAIPPNVPHYKRADGKTVVPKEDYDKLIAETDCSTVPESPEEAEALRKELGVKDLRKEIASLAIAVRNLETNMRTTLGLRTITAGEVAEAVWKKLVEEKYAGKVARLVYEIIESGTAPKE